MDTLDRRVLLAGAGLAGVAALSKLAQAGPLSPPAGPVMPTGATLSEISERIARTSAGVAEPRVPVTSLPGSAGAVHVISQPGSYYLTGDIQGVSGKNGMEITASDVTIDMRGHSLVGTPGAGMGVEIAGGLFRPCLRNGQILRWPGGATQCGPFVRGMILDGISVRDCGGYAGADAGAQATVVNSQFFSSGSDLGLSCAEGSLIASCLAYGCNVGLATVGRSLFANCVASGNSIGIKSSFFSQIVDCVCHQNGGPGIFAEFDCLVERCYVRDNGAGIVSHGGGCVRGCYASANQTGIAGSEIHLEGNVVVAGQTGISTSGRSMVIGNRARLVPTPYAFGSGGAYGPIVDVTGAGDIAAVSGANHPWANFIY